MTTLVEDETLVMVALVAAMVVIHMSVSNRDDYNGSSNDRSNHNLTIIAESLQFLEGKNLWRQKL